MKVKAKIVNKDIDQNREFEVLEEHANCYILKYDDKFLTVKKEWCKMVEENNDIYEVVTNKIEKEKKLTEKQFIEKCKEHSWDFKFEKDIKLPNEFYFKHKEAINVLFKAEFINDRYVITNDKNKESETYQSEEDVKEFIRLGFWIICDKPVVNEVDKNNTINNKKASKFIKVTNVADFKVFIAKDKIISIVEYEGKTHICTLDVAGDYIIIEKAEDVIKMLEE